MEVVFLLKSLKTETFVECERLFWKKKKLQWSVATLASKYIYDKFTQITSVFLNFDIVLFFQATAGTPTRNYMYESNCSPSGYG